MNESLYQASLKALQENGISEDLAIKASKIVATDEAGLPDLGRTPADQQIIRQTLSVMQNFWSSQSDE